MIRFWIVIWWNRQNCGYHWPGQYRSCFRSIKFEHTFKKRTRNFSQWPCALSNARHWLPSSNMQDCKSTWSTRWNKNVKLNGIQMCSDDSCELCWNSQKEQHRKEMLQLTPTLQTCKSSASDSRVLEILKIHCKWQLANQFVLEHHAMLSVMLKHLCMFIKQES